MKRTLRSNVTQFTMTFAGLLPFTYKQPAHDVKENESTWEERVDRQIAEHVEMQVLPRLGL